MVFALYFILVQIEEIVLWEFERNSNEHEKRIEDMLVQVFCKLLDLR
jgi:hypothetical protein